MSEKAADLQRKTLEDLENFFWRLQESLVLWKQNMYDD